MLGSHNSAISLADGYGNLDPYFQQYFKWIKWVVRAFPFTSWLKTQCLIQKRELVKAGNWVPPSDLLPALVVVPLHMHLHWCRIQLQFVPGLPYSAGRWRTWLAEDLGLAARLGSGRIQYS